MKNKMKRILLRALLTVMFVSTLLCAASVGAPLVAYADGGETFGLREANGMYVLGGSAIADPLRVETEDGHYMVPQSYVYFGASYDSSSQQNTPILWRVLDNDHDNAGGEGAAFLLSENVISPTARFSAKYDDNWNNDNGYDMYYFGRYENTYNGSYLAENETALKNFYAEERSAIKAITKDDSDHLIGNGFGYNIGDSDIYVDIKEEPNADGYSLIEIRDHSASEGVVYDTFYYKVAGGEGVDTKWDIYTAAEVETDGVTSTVYTEVTNARQLSFIFNAYGIPIRMMHSKATEHSMPFETNVYVLEKNSGSLNVDDIYETKRSYWITENQHFVSLEDVQNETDPDKKTQLFSQLGYAYHKTSLDGARIFPLSVAELEHYVGSYNGVPGLRASLLNTNAPSGWILRTAYDNDAVLCDQIGYVTVDGRVTFADADLSLGGRYATNVDLSQIVYMTALDDGNTTWRPTLTFNKYQSGDVKFEAKIIDVTQNEDDTKRVTVEYKNAVSRISFADMGENDYISAMVVRDGDVRYYGNVGYAHDADLKYNEIDPEAHTITFDLPEDFDQSAGDEIRIFWERVNDDERMTSYVSNSVTLDCVHTETAPATCSTLKKCSDCSVEYGTLDPDNHSGELTWVESTETLEHWQDCPNCDAQINKEECDIVADCTSVTPCTACGRDDLDPSAHKFDDDGICTLNSAHYEAPTLVDGYYEITKIGHLHWFSEQVGEGNTEINGALAISGGEWDLSGITFNPIGQQGTAYKGHFDGRGVTVTNLSIDMSAYDIGFFGVTDGATIENLIIEDSSIVNGILSVGAIVGDAKNTTIKNCAVIWSTVSGTQGVNADVGALVGMSDADTKLISCFAYEVIDNEDNVLSLIGNGAAALENSFYLADAENENGGRTNDQFASGELAYAMGDAWGQSIEYDPYPVINGDKVYSFKNCMDNTVYTNDADGYNVHFYNEAVSFAWGENYATCTATLKCTECQSTVTVPCDRVETNYFGGVRAEYYAVVTLSNGDTEYSDRIRFIIKTIKDVTAVEPLTKVFDGEAVSATDMMENTQMKYWDVPSGMREFTAFFMPAGSVTVDTVKDVSSFVRYRNQAVTVAGTYDLIVIGKNNYEHQIAIFENVLTIEKAKLTLVIDPIDRAEDGSKDVELNCYFAEDTLLHLDWLNITLGKPISSAVGVYDLNVTVTYNKGYRDYSRDENDNFELDANGNPVMYYAYEGYAESVELTYSSTASFEILRNIYVEIANKNWAAQYKDTADSNYNGNSSEILITYGTPVPAPVSDNFTVTAGSTLRYEWYEMVGDPWDHTYKKLSSKPVNAGDYVLRVIGSATADYVESFIDIEFSITLKELTVTMDNPDSYEKYVASDGETWYVFGHGDALPTFTVGGFVYDDSMANLPIDLYCNLDGENYRDEIESEFPDASFIGRYSARAMQLDTAGVPYNYDSVNESIYVVIMLPATLTPEGYTDSWNGEVKGIDLNMFHPVLEGESDVFYRLIVKDENGDVIFSNPSALVGDYNIPNYYLYQNELLIGDKTIKAEGTYTAVVQATTSLGDYSDVVWTDVETITFTVNFTDAYAPAGAEDAVSEIRDVGKYLVTVTIGDDPATAIVNTAEVTVVRELRIYVKETRFDLDNADGKPFDIKDLVFEAGFMPMLGHTIVDLDYFIDAARGEITVNGWTIVDASGADVSDIYVVNTTVYSWRHNNGGLNVVHIFDNACDATCNIAGCDVARVPDSHKGGTATCTERAICEVCGSYYGNLDAYDHTSTETLFVPDQYNGMLHNKVHACCGATIMSEEHHTDVAANCTDRAICKVCNSDGVPFGELDPDNHTSSEYLYESNGAFTHAVVHACCKAHVKDETHGGGDATCKALAVCDKCKTSYGELDADDHEQADKATYTANGATHKAFYPCCEVTVTESHSGGEATCTEQAVCQYCSTPYGEKDADNHSSSEYKYALSKTSRTRHDVMHSCCGALVRSENHSGGEATCLEKASCEYCDTPYGTKDLENHASDKLVCEPNMIDPSTHDCYYSCCDEWHSSAKHSGGTATCQTPAICEGCGVFYGDTLEHVYDNRCDHICNLCNEQTRAMTFHSDANGDEKCDHCPQSMKKEETDDTN